LLLIILVPSILFTSSLVEGAQNLGEQLETNQFEVPPATDKVKEWPFIGERAYNAWTLASSNIEKFATTYSEQLAAVGKSILASIVSTGTGILQFILSVIIAGILLTYSDSGGKFTETLFNRISGNQGTNLLNLCNNTIRNVAKGVLGVAFIQGFLIGIGMLLAGVPYAGLWTLICFILAMIQLPPTLIVIPVIVYLFSQDSGVMTIVWSVYLILASISDDFLKPILLGKGAPVPMLVIFLGVVGGFIASGFIGLFIGAIVLSVGYKLMIAWVNDKQEENNA
jgi:predicted PurR-regulated permease PerM